jgi:Polyketide cyclase / dehydrase and lipid transport
MPFDVRVAAHIAKPPDEVAGYMFDPSHDLEWITGIEQVDPLAAPVGVGTETHRHARFMGRRIDYVLKVVEHVPNRRLVMESVQAPFPMGVTYGVEPDGSGSRVSLRVTGGYGLLMSLAQPIMSWQIKRSLQADLRHLRGRLEMNTTTTRTGEPPGDQR